MICPHCKRYTVREFAKGVLGCPRCGLWIDMSLSAADMSKIQGAVDAPGGKRALKIDVKDLGDTRLLDHDLDAILDEYECWRDHVLNWMN